MIDQETNIRVSIFDEYFTLASDESIELVERAANAVDLAMRQLTNSVKNVDSRRIAILVAVQFAHACCKNENQCEVFSEKALSLIKRIDCELV